MGASVPDSSGPLHIVPSEAQHIAGHFRMLAAEAERIAASVEAVGHRLNRSWVGESRDDFFDVFARAPSEFEALAGSIRSKAHRISTIHVVVWPGETGPS